MNLSLRVAHFLRRFKQLARKAPGKKADFASPFILRRGQTVLDAARLVHKDFAEHLKFARLYRTDGDRDGLLVERTHLVQDEDILEFHI